MTAKEKLQYLFQWLFGYPILAFAIAMIILDSAGYVNVEKFGYAFFGGVITYFLQYFFRKGIKK
jgi:hypothetical protein